MNIVKIALLAALFCASVFGQFDPSINPQVTRVYNITSATASVEGSCTIAGGIGVDYGTCYVDFEYGTLLPFTQTVRGVTPIPAESGRATATMTGLPPDTTIYVRAVSNDSGFPVTSQMVSFRTAKSGGSSGSIYVTLWDDECLKTRACVNVFWSSVSSPFTSVFMGVNGGADYYIIGTGDSCDNCRVPIDKNKEYRFVVYTSRTAEKVSRPAGTLLAEMTYHVP